MSTNDSGYTIVSQTHINKFNPDSGNVESGYEITVRDGQTNVVFPVFLADAYYTADNAKQLIELNLERVRAVHSLGQ